MSIRAAAETSEQKENENEESFQKLAASHEQLNDSYKKLLNDHEELQKMYMQIETDYEEVYAESSQKHSQVIRLKSELDDLEEKYVETLDKFKKTEAKLNVLLDRAFVDSGVNTIESDYGYSEQKYQSREEIERIYESKFNELNKEMVQLKYKVK